MMERFRIDDILAPENIDKAIRHMIRKKTACGCDGMFAVQLPDFWKRSGSEICELIRNERYIPQPSYQIRIRKPNGGMRILEIPAVRDRMLQYAMCRVLQPYYETMFCDRSYGFRSNRSTLDAVALCVGEMNEGRVCIADLDIKSYFDRVDQRKLLAILGRDMEDGAVKSLISAYLGMKVINGHHIFRKVIGLPQGGPISPLLANIYLNELDAYMGRSGFHFVRYADDIVILCRDREEAEESMAAVEEYLKENLRLLLNRDKTKIVAADELHFLGYAFCRKDGSYRASIGDKEWEKMQKGMEHNMNRDRPDCREWWDRMGAYNRGWLNYYIVTPLEDLGLYAAEMERIENEKIVKRIHSPTAMHEYALLNSKSYISPLGWHRRLEYKYGEIGSKIQDAKEESRNRGRRACDK